MVLMSRLLLIPHQVDRSIDLRRFPDYRIYHVCSLSLVRFMRSVPYAFLQIISTDNSLNLACGVVTVSLSRRVFESTTPEKPEEGTVNPGYDPENDEDRPQLLFDYLR